jgi:diguanylate cyclase
MSFSWTVLAVVLVLGVVQLAVGVVFGRALPNRQLAAPDSPQHDAKRLRHLAGELLRVTAGVAHDVDEHQVLLRKLNEDLRSVQPGEGDRLAEFVLKLVGQIVQVNGRLQGRLNAAERQVQAQATQIEMQINKARTDPLTRLPNRRAFDEELWQRVAQWQRNGTSFCLMLIDVDRFKELNDRHGHPTGDQVLRDLAKVIPRGLRDIDLVARLGGDEFAVILPGAEPREAQRVGERIRSMLVSEVAPFGHDAPPITVSLGVAAMGPGDDLSSLPRRADEALYAAKRAGRNCGHFHNGQACVPILPADQTATGAPPGDAESQQDPNPNASPNIELVGACDDLRSRLAEVAEEGPDLRTDQGVSN